MKRKTQNEPTGGVPVVGCHENGTRYWYTGKAGDAFVSQDPKEAFRYGTVEEARRKAAVLNKGLPQHAIMFMACVGDLAKEGR